MIVIVMGVTASGKTTVGEKLAQRMGWIFVDADDYHSQQNKEKMAAGIALTDADRTPWLAALNGLLQDWSESGISGVLACSALKQQYRDLLCSEVPPKLVHFIWLDAPRELLEEHIRERAHSFMNPKLLDSQLQTLEPPADAFKVEALGSDGHPLSVDEEVEAIVTGLSLTPAS